MYVFLSIKVIAFKLNIAFLSFSFFGSFKNKIELCFASCLSTPRRAIQLKGSMTTYWMCSTGGICADFLYPAADGSGFAINTGLTTTNGNTQTLSTYSTMLITAHELGHNAGWFLEICNYKISLFLLFPLFMLSK